MRFKRTVVSAVALTALVGGLTACGDDDDDTGDDAAPTAEAIDLTVTASKSGDQYLYDIPAEIDGGLVNLTLKNDDAEPHEIALMKVTEGTDPAGVGEWLANEGAPIPDFFEDTIAGVGNAAPGASATSSQEITPGSYVYFCTFGDGDAVHYKNGMLGAVTVANSDGGGEIRDHVSSITAEDYSFEFDGLKAGTNAVEFTNDGPDQIHHALFFPLAEGATTEEALAFLGSEEEPTGPPPIDFERSTNTMVMAPGDTQVQDLTLEAGNYLVVCFLSDVEGGPPHALPPEAGGHGMVSPLTVE
jgi:plastocyanin